MCIPKYLMPSSRVMTRVIYAAATVNLFVLYGKNIYFAEISFWLALHVKAVNFNVNIFNGSKLLSNLFLMLLYYSGFLPYVLPLSRRYV